MSYTIVRILQNSVICLLYAGSLRKPNCKLVADINIDLQKQGVRMWAALNRFRTGFFDELLWTW